MSSNPAAHADAPPPWSLTGRGFISLLRFPEPLSLQEAGIPPLVEATGQPSRYCWMMAVDYTDSAVGPYHELLFIPGSLHFAHSGRLLTIGRIFVSSMASVVNGRANWGIPKDEAEFQFADTAPGQTQIALRQDAQEPFAELQYQHRRLSLPFTTAILPSRLHTLGQEWEGQEFRYTPTASGQISPAKLVHARADGLRFPALQRATPLMSVAVKRFSMIFPVANIYPLGSKNDSLSRAA